MAPRCISISLEVMVLLFKIKEVVAMFSVNRCISSDDRDSEFFVAATMNKIRALCMCCIARLSIPLAFRIIFSG